MSCCLCSESVAEETGREAVEEDEEVEMRCERWSSRYACRSTSRVRSMNAAGVAHSSSSAISASTREASWLCASVSSAGVGNCCPDACSCSSCAEPPPPFDGPTGPAEALVADVEDDDVELEDEGVGVGVEVGMGEVEVGVEALVWSRSSC